MFERFTDQARRVVVLAQDEAKLLHHGFIGTEHILLGMIRQGDGAAAIVLESFGLVADTVREQVRIFEGQGEQQPIGNIPFTPRAKKVMQLALREALALGHNYIGTEHILLALIREGEGVGMRVLTELKVGVGQLRHAITRLLAGESPIAPLVTQSHSAQQAVITIKKWGSSGTFNVHASDDQKVEILQVSLKYRDADGEVHVATADWTIVDKVAPTFGSSDQPVTD